MNELPQYDWVYKTISEELEYVFKKRYCIDWNKATTNQKLHFLSTVSAYLSYAIEDLMEVD